MSIMQPPKWARRFLSWYCNPELMEEIQGDAMELYYMRLSAEGKRMADWKYVRDVFRFFRWSNIQRTGNGPGHNGFFWTLTFRMAWRNAWKNKLIFSVKVLGLAACMAFALAAAVFVTSELTFDHYHNGYEQIWRLGSRAGMPEGPINYAVSPLPLAPSVVSEVPGVERATRVMFHGYPIYKIGDASHNNAMTLSADSSFFRIFKYDFIHGNTSALDEPGTVVLTESTSKQLFGDADPVGKVIDLGSMSVKVTAVVADLPVNTHLRFDAVFSWESVTRKDSWGNLNCYTYVRLQDGIGMDEMGPRLNAFAKSHEEEVTQGYNDVTYDLILENVGDIHLSPPLNEDIAVKGSPNNAYILLAMVVLFLLTGLINYLNLTLAELTSNLKKIGVLRVFGGLTAGSTRIVVSDTIFNLLLTLPIALVLSGLCWRFAETYFSIRLEPSVLSHPAFMLGATGFVFLLLLSTRINSYVLSRSKDIVSALKGNLSSKQRGFPVREFLVATQLSFSMVMMGIIFIFVDQFRFLSEADKGFEDRNTVVVHMRSGDYSKVQVFQDEVRKLSGVKGAAATSYYPGVVETKYMFDVQTENGLQNKLVNYMTVGYDFADLMRLQIVKGRNFDRKVSTDVKGAYLVNETAAREFGWQDPVGKRMEGPLNTNGMEGEVIGMIRDFNFMSLHEKIEPVIIFLENPDWGVAEVYVKTESMAGTDLLQGIERVYKKSFGDGPFEFNYLDLKYASLYQDDEKVRRVVEAGLVISLILSSLGIFSISALLTIVRSKEMGIRKVVGASALSLFAMHMKTFTKFLVIALVLALPGIFFLSNTWLESFAYHIGLHAGYFVLPVVITGVIIIVTGGYHGWKTAHVNPVEVLKDE